MSTEDTTVLGIIRGLMEFLPLSSSGYLVIFQHLIGLRGPEALLDIALHVGTLLAILKVFRADVTIMIIENMGFVRLVLRKGKPTGQVQQSPHAALAFWTLLGMAPTALLGVILSLFFQEMFASTFLVCLMLIVTGAVLLASSLDRDLAGRFSLLLSIPAITRASALKFDMREITEIGLIPFLTGILVALKITMIASWQALWQSFFRRNNHAQ